MGHYGLRTEQAYVSWTRRFVRHHRPTHPEPLAEADVVSFLRYLAEDQHVAQSTQAQALAALQLAGQSTFCVTHVAGPAQEILPCFGEPLHPSADDGKVYGRPHSAGRTQTTPYIRITSTSETLEQ